MTKELWCRKKITAMHSDIDDIFIYHCKKLTWKENEVPEQLIIKCIKETKSMAQ